MEVLIVVVLIIVSIVLLGIILGFNFKKAKSLQEDKTLEIKLLSDEKELAEHNMLVDLGRNDLGKISKFNTVKVELDNFTFKLGLFPSA